MRARVIFNMTVFSSTTFAVMVVMMFVSVLMAVAVSAVSFP